MTVTQRYIPSCNSHFNAILFIFILQHHQQSAVAACFAMVGPMAEKGLVILIGTQAADIDMLFC